MDRAEAQGTARAAVRSDQEEHALLDELRVLAGPAPDQLGGPVSEAEAKADEEAIINAVRRSSYKKRSSDKSAS